MRYHTILFDADNTLLDFARSERAALTEALQKMGVVASDEMIAAYSAINLSMWKRLERGEITKGELREARFAEFCRRFDLSLDVRVLADHYLESLATKSFLMEGALAVCETLAAHCRLYIITNGIARVQHGRFDVSPLYPLFEDTFISDEIGHEKPSTAFFDAVRRKIPDFDAATTLVVGDSLTSDIAGGIAAGLDTCWYDRNSKGAPQDMAITYTVHTLEEILPLVLR
ncbi:MAG: YjjG family noncanonical pyrimidine nucleotidase [Clostridia bacterium]|nr:YjjG family noncanonical pyrimidine nucleotidase [Clostridia bacterium]